MSTRDRAGRGWTCGRSWALGFVKQDLRCECDTLLSLANSHHELRQFLGHADVWDRRWYKLRTLVENVNLLTPELLGKLNRLVVEHGRAMAGQPPLEILFGRGDSFVAKPTSTGRRT